MHREVQWLSQRHPASLCRAGGPSRVCWTVQLILVITKLEPRVSSGRGRVGWEILDKQWQEVACGFQGCRWGWLSFSRLKL